MEQLDMFKAEDTTAWVYESPDGGQTVYRRKLLDPHYKRELVKQVDDNDFEYSTWVYRQDWDELSNNQTIKDYLDKLRVMVALMKEE